MTVAPNGNTLLDMTDAETYLKKAAALVNRELAARLPRSGECPTVLRKAMRYSALSGGKRIRPALCMAAAEAAGASPAVALVPALALEALHTYTLIHDDLPCMDNDDFRRGKATLHRVFGEANALLAGDALLTIAFEWLASTSAPPPWIPGRLSFELAVAAGGRGVVGGQVEDLAAEQGAVRSRVGRAALLVKRIHERKTAALIVAAARMGGIAAGASEETVAALGEYGRNVGLAFQIADDVLNATATARELGKPVRTDRRRGKLTCVSVHGLRASRGAANRLVGRAIRCLRALKGDTAPLAALARYAADRTS